MGNSKLKVEDGKLKIKNKTPSEDHNIVDLPAGRQGSSNRTIEQLNNNRYDPHKIEKRWQDIWLRNKIYEPDLDNAKKPFYNLMMFPYPSAEGLHVGSFFTYGGIDAYGRFMRMQGYDVFEPIGLDGFGIHSENYAIKVGRTPQEHAKISEENFYRQLKLLGNGFDWSRKLETYDPEYYKWTQWLFIELFKAGLSYKAKATVNFCPSCKTVLSDEQVIDSKCERCSTVVEKRELEQWFFKITDYAERLLANTEKLDWTEKVKIAQKNWIGKKTGAIIEFKVQNSKFKIDVFTTRPDTLFGATFLVIAPEHPLVEKLSYLSDNREKIMNYVSASIANSAQDRLAEGKEKNGVPTGVYAVNPVNNEEIPVWIADYVLMDYGTGAIMAVPAHDQRDFEFAKKYKLPIKQVIVEETGIKRTNEEQRDGGYAVIFDPETQKYGISTYPDGNLRLYGGGVDKDEDLEKGIVREVSEESGLFDFAYVEKIRTHFAHFYNSRKKINRSALATGYLIILKSKTLTDTQLDSHEVDMKLTWLSPVEILKNWEAWNRKENGEGGIDHWIDSLKQAVGRAIELGYDKTNSADLFKHTAYTSEGIIVDSDNWNSWQTPDSIDMVISWLEDKGIGKKSVNYHLRDWLISRQRYWGPPIPMIYCEVCAKEGKSWFTDQGAKGQRDKAGKDIKEKEISNFKFQISNSATWNVAGWYPEENLPVLLPDISDFTPRGSGKGPLADHPEFYETKCPGCGADADRETDVSDTFLDSSWYFFRYLATDREDVPFPMQESESQRVKVAEIDNNRTIEQYNNFGSRQARTINTSGGTITDRLAWLPVTSYIGGAEHAVLHLLYSRFISMVLKDLGYIDFEEPFAKFRANGLIIKDGAKMSKSKGNVINPDEYIRKFGSDTLRTYLGFIGPFTQGGDFQDSGIEGINRFLKRVWTIVVNFVEEQVIFTDNKRIGTEVISENQLPNPRKSLSMMHRTIKGVTEDMEELRFNTAIAKIMTYYNFLSDQTEIRQEEIEVLLKLLAPFAPHMTEELWDKINADNEQISTDLRKSASDQWNSIHVSEWPLFDPSKIVSDTVTIAIQINGKLRDTIEVQSSKLEVQSEIEQLAKVSENVAKHLTGKTIRKVIYVPGKIVNFVI